LSVSNGQAADENTFNNGFLSRTTSSGTIGIINLLNPSSGGNIVNLQQAVNDNTQNTSQNTVDIGNLDTRVDNLETSITQNNFTATVDPTVDDDSASGYVIGSEWINTTTKKIFKAVDVTIGSAVWKRIDKIMLKSLFPFFTDNLSVDDTAWVELIADTGADKIVKIQSFYPNGSIAKLAIGAASSEQELIILQPGGNGETGLEVEVPANSRLSIRLESGETALSSVKLALNLFGEA